MSIVQEFIHSAHIRSLERDFLQSLESVAHDKVITKQEVSTVPNSCSNVLTRLNETLNDENYKRSLISRALNEVIIKIMSTTMEEEEETDVKKHIAFVEEFAIKVAEDLMIPLYINEYGVTHFRKVDEYEKQANFDGMIHEAFVGLFAMNKLRAAGVYNFMWTHGMNIRDQSAHFFGERLGERIVVSSAAVDKKSVTTSFPRALIFLELLHGTPLSKLQLNKEEMISVLNQIYCALKIANNSCKFTHNDLHLDNIMIVRISDESFHLRYCLDGKEIFVYSPGILAVIIDYERAVVEMDNVIYSPPLNEISYLSLHRLAKVRSNIKDDLYGVLITDDNVHHITKYMEPFVRGHLRNGETLEDFLDPSTFPLLKIEAFNEVSDYDFFVDLASLIGYPEVGKFEENVGSYLQCYDKDYFQIATLPEQLPIVNELDDILKQYFTARGSATKLQLALKELHRIKSPDEQTVIDDVARGLFGKTITELL